MPFIVQISMTKNSCKVSLKEFKHWMKPERAKTTLTSFPSSAEIVSEPLGVVLVISAWNYPFLLSLDPVIGAIAVGNAVVLKPSEISPATSSLMARLLPEYLDRSVARIVEGAVAETTALLEQRWDKIFYTGNGKVGCIVMAAAAKHLTPVVLELGGKSPVVVDSNINLDVSSKRIIAGKLACNNGQACIAPDYVITRKSFAPKLIDAFKHTLEKFYGKDPMESKDLSRIVNSNHFSRLAKLLDDEKVAGKIVHGGQRDEKQPTIAPTILLDVPQDSLIMNEEIFGPLLPIITVDKVEDSFNAINSKSKPPAAYLFTKNKQLEKDFVNAVSAGGMLINDTCIHVILFSFSHAYISTTCIHSYMMVKMPRIDDFLPSSKARLLYETRLSMTQTESLGFGGEASARYPPYTPKKQRLLRALLNGDIIGLILALIGWPRV
ncbi:aldehyde dehydrogenase family 3 member H1-like [Magnolia sinica]|uniref:aldehyde dehydrogenase family 3 member H1-like n=1 Tax=Magnolia sinica TaxID=86752 RepID=UPI00265A3C1A|nr:aldehyde dehydrogenase family 3 member H1-like [Magnolia sinica]